MINLQDYIRVIDGEEYVPLKKAQEAISEVFSYDKKLDSEMNKVQGYLKNISKTLNTNLNND